MFLWQNSHRGSNSMSKSVLQTHVIPYLILPCALLSNWSTKEAILFTMTYKSICRDSAALLFPHCQKSQWYLQLIAHAATTVMGLYCISLLLSAISVYFNQVSHTRRLSWFLKKLRMKANLPWVLFSKSIFFSELQNFLPYIHIYQVPASNRLKNPILSGK